MVTLITILQLICALLLVLVVLFQSGKESGMEALSGKNESYLGKSKAGSLDKVLASATKWVALVWIVLTLALNLV